MKLHINKVIKVTETTCSTEVPSYIDGWYAVFEQTFKANVYEIDIANFTCNNNLDIGLRFECTNGDSLTTCSPEYQDNGYIKYIGTDNVYFDIAIYPQSITNITTNNPMGYVPIDLEIYKNGNRIQKKGNYNGLYIPTSKNGVLRKTNDTFHFKVTNNTDYDYDIMGFINFIVTK